MLSAARYVPAAILLIGSALNWRAHSQAGAPISGSLRDILPAMSGYKVVENKVSEGERRVAGMTDYIARTYVKDSSIAFSTLVSYYDRQTQGKTIHSPRNCLPGAGWEIVSGGPKSLDANGESSVVNRYVLKNGASTAIVYYWYQGRGRVTANEYRVKWNLLRDAMLTGHTEEALVRVVVPVQRSASASADADMRSADATAESIAKVLVPAVTSVLPNPRAG